jgi:VWFA-related protein
MNLTIRRILRFAPLAVLACLVHVDVRGQAGGVFRGQSDVVSVYVSVADRSHRLVTGLPVDAFEVRDQGTTRPIIVFDNAPQPIQLIVMLDVSGTMFGNVKLLHDASSHLIAQLGDRDVARFGSFGREISLSPAFSADRDVLLGSLPASVEPNAPTPFWYAMDHALSQFTPTSLRKVLLVLSDGRDTSTNSAAIDATSVREKAMRENVMIYGVAMSSRPPVSSLAPRPRDLGALLEANQPNPELASLALGTGGGFKELTRDEDLAAEFARIVNELHQQYLLGFEPTGRDGKVHRLEVRVKGGHLIRARQSYLAAQ